MMLYVTQIEQGNFFFWCKESATKRDASEVSKIYFKMGVSKYVIDY